MSEASGTPRAPILTMSGVTEKLQEMIVRECGAGRRIVNFGAMEEGHAGQTFGFDVVGSTEHLLGRYVLKVAPIGVARRGNTDVYRQAPLLRALKSVGLPVPDVPWASPDEEQLGTPFIVMERMPGRMFLVWGPHESFSREAGALRAIWLQSARLLARLHGVDWTTCLSEWEAPRPLAEEFERWPLVLRHAQDPDWLAGGTELGALLASAMPDGAPIGVVHGDFQPGNILHVNGEAGGLIDWELASIGSQGLDLGWLLMMSDPRAWHEDWRPLAGVPAEDLIAAYREAGGPAYHDLAWHQALAHYRLGSIACLNVKLHRTGKRVDALWERFAPSIPYLFARGAELARQSSQGTRP